MASARLPQTEPSPSSFPETAGFSGGARLRLALVLASLSLSVLIGLTLSRPRGDGGGGDARPGARTGRRVTIGISFDTLKEERWQRDRAAFVARARELGAEVRDLAANSNDAQQVRDVESLITSRIDVLVLIAHNGPAMAKAVGMAHAAGVPVVAYDRLIPDCDLDFYITFDAVKVGAVQAQYLVDHLKPRGHGRILRLHGAKTDPNAHFVKQGQDRVLAPFIERGELVVAHEDWVDEWKPEAAKRITNAALARLAPMAVAGPVLAGILAPNDGTAGGAVQALLEESGGDARRVAEVVVTGQDAELSACQRVLAGTQTMTVYKPLQRLASRAAEVAYAFATGKTVVATAETDNGRIRVPSILVDVVAVDRENLEDTVVRDGFHTEAALRGAARDGRAGRGQRRAGRPRAGAEAACR